MASSCGTLCSVGGDTLPAPDSGPSCDPTGSLARLVSPYLCTASVCGLCGNGVVEANEVCDTGANNGGFVGCDYGLRSCSVCSRSCVWQAGGTQWCGDGTLNADAEQCDVALSCGGQVTGCQVR